MDGLAARVVEAGDVEQARGHGEVGGQVTRAAEAEQQTRRGLVSRDPDPVEGDGRGGVEHGEGVDHESELLVREEAVEADEGEAGEDEDDRPSVQHGSQGQEEDRRAESPGQDRVEVPEQGLGAPVSGLVQHHIEPHDLGLGPEEPPPEVRVHTHRQGDPHHQREETHEEHVFNAHLKFVINNYCVGNSTSFYVQSPFRR